MRPLPRRSTAATLASLSASIATSPPCRHGGTFSYLSAGGGVSLALERRPTRLADREKVAPKAYEPYQHRVDYHPLRSARPQRLLDKRGIIGPEVDRDRNKAQRAQKQGEVP